MCPINGDFSVMPGDDERGGTEMGLDVFTPSFFMTLVRNFWSGAFTLTMYALHSC